MSLFCIKTSSFEVSEPCVQKKSYDRLFNLVFTSLPKVGIHYDDILLIIEGGGEAEHYMKREHYNLGG